MRDLIGHICLGCIYAGLLFGSIQLPAQAWIAPWVFAIIREFDQWMNHDNYEPKTLDRIGDVIGVASIASVYLFIKFN